MICFLLVGIRSCTARSRSTPATAGWLLLCSNLPCGGDYISDVPEKRPSLPWTGGPVLPSCAQFQFDAISFFSPLWEQWHCFVLPRKTGDIVIWPFGNFVLPAAPQPPGKKKLEEITIILLRKNHFLQ